MTADTQNQHSSKTQSDYSAEQIAFSIQLTRETLDFGVDELSYEVTERLRATRVRALAQAKSTVNSDHKQYTPVTSTAVTGWHRQLINWLKGGAAISALTLAAVISFVSIRSEVTTHVAVSERAMSLSSSPSDATTAATTQETAEKTAPNVEMSSESTTQSHSEPVHIDPAANTAVAHAQVNTQPSQANRTLVSKDRSLTTSTQNSLSAESKALSASPAERLSDTQLVSSTDAEIDMVLREEIPLQAYLNDDFTRYANHQGLEQIEQNSTTTN